MGRHEVLYKCSKEAAYMFNAIKEKKPNCPADVFIPQLTVLISGISVVNSV